MTKCKLLSVVTPCYNEERNVDELAVRIRTVMESLPYDYEHIFIDNCSTDETVTTIRTLAAADKRIKLIRNTRNFGHIRSPYHALLQSGGDACMLLAADLQDPPEMIPQFVSRWEEGFKTVLAVKPRSEEKRLMRMLRKLYYQIVTKIADVPLVLNATGAGLFDRCVLDVLRKMDDPYPYFRGLVCEIGYPIATVPFAQPQRTRGVTKNNFFTLYDITMLGIVSHSKLPLRFMTIGGFLISVLSLLTAMVVLFAKLLFWDQFVLGMAPVLIGVFLLGSVQMLFIGILGEYTGMIYTQVRKLPLVVEAERVNFTNPPGV